VLCEQSFYDLGGLAIGERGGCAVAFVAELRVAQAEAVQKRRVPVVMMHNILHCVMSPFVGLAMNVTGLVFSGLTGFCGMALLLAKAP